MKLFAPRVCWPAFAAVALLCLASCGGGDANPVPPEAQSISATTPGKQSLGTAPAALVATSTSGLAVSWVSNSTSVCTVNGTALSLLSTGNCSLSASQAGNALFAPAATLALTFEVAQGSQSITFVSPGNQPYGVAPINLVASASSGLAVVFASSTPSVCSVNGSTFTLLALGSCSISASQAGNPNFAAAPSVSNTFAVAAAMAAQVITFGPLGNPAGTATLGAAPLSLLASASSGLMVAFASTTTPVCTVSSNQVSLLGVGTCTVVASQAGDLLYAGAAAVSQSISVAPTAQSISFSNPGNQRLGTAPGLLVASASSGLAVTISSSTAGVCSVSGSNLALLAVGTCTLTANQAGSARFAAAPLVLQTFQVLPALLAQSISFASPGNQVLGTPAATLVASSTAGLAVSVVSNTAAVCSVSGSTLNLLAAGACSLSASQAGNATYAAALPVTVTFVVAAAPLAQSISFAMPTAQRLGTPAAALVASATSGLVVSFASSTPAVCSTSGNNLSLLTVGDCSITASQAGNASYAAATPVVNTFVVSAAAVSQTITFTAPGAQRLGTAPAALVARATSGLLVSFSSTTPSVCGASGNTLTLLAVGSCTLSASQAGNAVYAAATPVTQTFSVSAALLAQSISFSPLAAQQVGNTPPPLVASASSGLVVLFTGTTPSVCIVNGNSVTLLTAGTCAVLASQPGNTLYAAATPVAQSFVVTSALLGQTIIFVSPGSQTLGTLPAELQATASSGLTVVFVSTTASVCSVNVNTLSLLSAGTCGITASQPGNTTFAAAPLVAVSFTVNAAPAAPVELMANGSFETAPGAGQIAFGWRGANSVPATWSTDARSGGRSAAMAVPDPGFGGSGLVQNAVDDGGRPSILGRYVGKTTNLSFWAKGNASITGNLVFSLRYLDAVGNILNPVVNTAFGSRINANTWSRISLTGPALPANTSAIFLEMTLAVGPTGVTTNPDGTVTNYGQARVLIDDVSVTVIP